jgi:phage tail protein X
MDTINYTCGDGETWTGIAYKVYGSLSGLPSIIEANPQVPIDTILPFGTILLIPIIDSTSITYTHVTPWQS